MTISSLLSAFWFNFLRPLLSLSRCCCKVLNLRTATTGGPDQTRPAETMNLTDDEEILKKLEDSTKDATRGQLEALRSILEHQSKGGGVRYLRPYLQGYDAPVDANTFRQAVPLSSYEDYVDHINQMADNGPVDHDHDHDHDQPLLSVDPLICFFYRFTYPLTQLHDLISKIDMKIALSMLLLYV